MEHGAKLIWLQVERKWVLTENETLKVSNHTALP